MKNVAKTDAAKHYATQPNSVKLKVWGRNALFSRPEFSVERVSYDVITPTAARGILSAIHWKPAIEWHIDRLIVLNPIKFTTFRRNEVEDRIHLTEGMAKKLVRTGRPFYMNAPEKRQQRSALILRDVAYVIEAHFELTGQADERDSYEKHFDIFTRRARNGQCFKQPVLGSREYPASFELLEAGAPLPPSALQGEVDLGWMLKDIIYRPKPRSVYYRPIMRNGVIEVPGAAGAP